jgi:hypothetical protein
MRRWCFGTRLPEVAEFLAPETVLMRACLFAVARRGYGELSAAELAMALPSLPCAPIGGARQGGAPGVVGALPTPARTVPSRQAGRRAGGRGLSRRPSG